jgi:hypothetical protein
MRRAANIVIVFALLGTALTVAIAWVSALLSEPGAFDPLLMAKFRKEFFSAEDQPKEQRQFWVTEAYPGVGVQFADVTIDEPDIKENFVTGPMPALAIVRAGWPLVALEGQWEHDVSRAGSRSAPRSRYAFELKSKVVQAGTFRMPRLIPMRPMWPNFALDVISIGGGLWLLWVVLLTLRRAIRMWRGQCPACAYPVGVSNVCTECGKPLRNRAAKLSA